MLSRQEQLEFCKICKHRKFEMQQGIICDLTQKKAAFRIKCNDFTEDKVAIHREQVFRAEAKQRNRPKDFTFGLDKIGIKNGIVAGSILLVIGTVWIIFGLTINRIFWYPFVLLLFGLIALINGIVNTIIRAKIDRDYKNGTRKHTNEDILDV